MASNYYKTRRHQTWRMRVLRRDEFLCQNCKRYGIHIDGNHAHHILPRSLYPEYRSATWNGVALCEKCHNEIEPRTGAYEPPEWLLRRLPAEIGHGY